MVESRLATLHVGRPPPDIELRWHILLCEPNRELVANKRLEQLGFEPYVPVIPHIATRSFRTSFGMQRKQFSGVRPLFPGYLFMQLNIAWEFGPIYTVPGLRTGPRQNTPPFLRIDRRHAILSERDMDTIRRIENVLRCPAVPGLPYRLGDKVRVLDGPFASLIATISKLDDAERIELLMDMVGGKVRFMASAKQIAVD